MNWSILDGAGDAARQLDNVGNAARQVDNVSDAAKVADDVGDAAHDVVRSGVLAQTQVDEILALPKGARPDPSTYLPDSYINSHLDEFEGGVTKIMSNAPTGTVGPPSGTFVMPKAVADELIEEAGGDVRKLENLLGLDPGALGDNRTVIRHMPHLRFARLNRRSTSTRSHSSKYACFLSAATTFLGLPGAGAESRIPCCLQYARLSRLRYILSARIRAG